MSRHRRSDDQEIDRSQLASCACPPRHACASALAHVAGDRERRSACARGSPREPVEQILATARRARPSVPSPAQLTRQLESDAAGSSGDQRDGVGWGSTRSAAAGGAPHGGREQPAGRTDQAAPNKRTPSVIVSCARTAASRADEIERLRRRRPASLSSRPSPPSARAEQEDREPGGDAATSRAAAT